MFGVFDAAVVDIEKRHAKNVERYPPQENNEFSRRKDSNPVNLVSFSIREIPSTNIEVIWMLYMLFLQ